MTTNKVPFIFQARRGTAAQVAAFTPAQGEVVADMTSYREVVGDGDTAGGFPVGRAQLKTLQDAATYTALVTDVVIVFTTMTAITHTVTLPAANAYPIGQELRIQNGTTVAGTIVIAAASSTDTINASTSISFSAGGTGRGLITNGSTGYIAYST
jgi:hypothetical protein